MIIESEVAKNSRYGEDALEAFYTAVDNGQARLAMSILVDIISAFADKIEALEEASIASVNEVKPPVKEEVKVDISDDEIKPASKQKVKEPVAE
jgi:choline kinase